ncbi:class I SAM-dependent methyltransferase [Pseudanabaena sp. Chao 1811]|uniref:class I SAM-dependent methyltransferase n=1 Tax=Pseudanabaena sp. Chao 1811 TaxID=2963092 RepID=UPI0022F3C9BD|nr:class I SAM-dependent methyltransferase [Pseudanabaena sp. Chao 1811]
MIDHTPIIFSPNTYHNQINIKRQILDQIIYPLSTKFTTYFNLFKYPELSNFSFDTDQLLFGERGSGFLSLAKKLKRLVPLKESKVFIQGCGLGQEALAWSSLGASSVLGMDLFSFEKGWSQISQSSQSTSIKFLDGDFCHTQLDTQIFDVISSFAVWEHIKDFESMLKETKRLIKPDGIVLSGFGPLWHTFSGDHFSAVGGLENGFNHLLLSQSDYFNWINSFEKQSSWATTEESYFEIRKHISEGLFSYLRPREYIQKVEKYFTRVHTITIISPEALAFRSAYPSKWQNLLSLDQMQEEDLLIKSLVLFLSPFH